MLKIFFENGRFRSFLIFQVFSGIGAGIFGIFMMWVIHFEYQNPFYTGLAGFMFAVLTIANFIIGPFVDRYNKAVLIRVTCFIRLIVVGLILITSITYMPGVWFLLLMILVFSATGLVSSPAETALLPRIVNSEDLMKANVFISITATIAGLGIGAFLFLMMRGGAGFEIVYAINTAFLLVALIVSAFLKSDEPKGYGIKTDAPFKVYLAELKEGIIFVKYGVVMLLVLTLVFRDIFITVAYVNLPMFAQVHSGEASGYIVLTAIAMVGGLVGSYISRIVGPKFEVWKILAACFVAAGVVRIVFVRVIADDFTRALWILVLYAGLGGTIGIMFNTLLQKLPPKGMVARVSTITTSLLGVTSALGALLGGIAGTVLPDVDMVFIIQGTVYIFIGLCICLPKRIRALPKIDDVRHFTI